MKVTTLNLAGYKNWHEREAKIVSYLNASQSDVVFLQEAKFDTAYSPFSQSRHLNSLLSSPYLYSQTSISRFYQPSVGEPYREGLAVLSTYPIIDCEVLALTKQPDDKHTRIIQIVRLLVDNQPVTFTNVHFSNNRHSTEQLHETVDILRGRGDQSCILGDFNIHDLQAVRDIYLTDYTASTEFTDYISFPSEAATFDYILIPKTYRFTSLNVGEGLSDHNAVTVEINIGA